MYTSPPEGVKVVAISERASDSADSMQPRSGFELVYDKELAREWNVYATPTALLFNQDGRLVGKAHAAKQLAELINAPKGKKRGPPGNHQLDL